MLLLQGGVLDFRGQLANVLGEREGPKGAEEVFMKTRIWQRFTAVTLLAVTTSISQAAERDDPKPAAPPNEAKPPAVTVTVTNPSAPVAPAAPTSVIPPKLSLPPLLDQVARLSKSGADEAVVKAYIEKAAPTYRVTGNDILDLQEQGVPKNVILSLIEHSKTATPSPESPAVPAATAETAASVPTVTAPLTPDVEHYYDALAPYGTWIEVADYGWAWQPTVVVVNPGWRPYCDNGSWLWSDSGWYWDSYYSWGWAPFHYGRWFNHPRSGWLWCPDRVWGPSWVTWRNSATHCGWAPLPPGACFTAGLGWSHWGVRVDNDCHFGIASAHFNFVAHERFTERHVGRHRLSGHDANTAFARTKVINHYSVGENNRVFNHGIGREQIAAARGSAIQQVAVSDAQPRRGNAVSGRNTVAMQNSSVARQVPSLPNRVAGASIGSSGTRASIGSSAAPRPTPNYSVASRSPSAQSYRSGNARVGSSVTMPRSYAAQSVNTTPRFSASPRTSAAPQMQSRYSQPAARSFAPSRSYTPSRSASAAPSRSFDSAPSVSRPSFSGRSSPSFGGRSSSFGGGGAGSRGSMSVGRSASAGRR